MDWISSMLALDMWNFHDLNNSIWFSKLDNFECLNEFQQTSEPQGWVSSWGLQKYTMKYSLSCAAVSTACASCEPLKKSCCFFYHFKPMKAYYCKIFSWNIFFSFIVIVVFKARKNFKKELDCILKIVNQDSWST